MLPPGSRQERRSTFCDVSKVEQDHWLTPYNWAYLFYQESGGGGKKKYVWLRENDRIRQKPLAARRYSGRR